MIPYRRAAGNYCLYLWALKSFPMPAKSLYLTVLLLLLTLPAVAREGGEGPQLGKVDYRGHVARMAEISGNFSFGDGFYKLVPPYNFGYSRMNSDGNTTCRKWFMINSLELFHIDSIAPHDFTEKGVLQPLTRNPLPLKSTGQAGTAPEPLVLSELLSGTYGEDTEFHYFYNSGADKKPFITIAADTAGTPFALVSFGTVGDPVEGIYHFRLNTFEAYTDIISYDGELMVRRENISPGGTGWHTEYDYDGSNLKEVRSYDTDGSVTEIIRYDRDMRPRSRVVMPSESHPHRYSYKYRYSGGNEVYTMSSVMGRGRHPWYYATVDSMAGHRVMHTMNEIAMPVKSRVNRRRGYGRIIRNSYSFRYNHHGDLMETEDTYSGSISHTIYRYDSLGNWFVKYDYNDYNQPDSRPRNATYRSIIYWGLQDDNK